MQDTPLNKSINVRTGNRLPSSEHPETNLSLHQSEMGQSQNFHNLNENNASDKNVNTKPRSSFLRRLKSIPIFNGESHDSMEDFIDIVDTLFLSILSQNEEIEFYDQLFLQIRGEAKNSIADIDQYDWQMIKDKILKYFSYLSNKDIINSKLENLRQEKNETLNDYIDRARKLLREKNSIYKNLTEEQREENNRMARKAFSRGVCNSKLKNNLLIRGANSLEDAVAYAIEADNDTVNEIQKNELVCRLCRLPGHRGRDCRRANNANSVGQLVAALQSLNPINQSMNTPYNNYNRRNGRYDMNNRQLDTRAINRGPNNGVYRSPQSNNNWSYNRQYIPNNNRQFNYSDNSNRYPREPYANRNNYNPNSYQNAYRNNNNYNNNNSNQNNRFDQNKDAQQNRFSQPNTRRNDVRNNIITTASQNWNQNQLTSDSSTSSEN